VPARQPGAIVYRGKYPDDGGAATGGRMARRRDHNNFMWGTIFVVLVVSGLMLWRWHGL